MRNISYRLAAVVAAGALGGWLLAPDVPSAVASPAASPRFSLCHSGGGENCVVDGDTIWFGGEKIRIADIDAPETHPPRCAREAALGRQATRRLQALLNRGAVTLDGDRRDRYGRRLAVVRQGGRSVGETLVDEGLARVWEGRRRPWCTQA